MPAVNATIVTSHGATSAFLAVKNKNVPSATADVVVQVLSLPLSPSFPSYPYTDLVFVRTCFVLSMSTECLTKILHANISLCLIIAMIYF
jgi:hypothetical protein